MNPTTILMTSLMATLASVACLSTAYGQMAYKERPHHQHDVFAVDGENRAFNSYTYVPYKEWKTKFAGQFFNLEIAPVPQGRVQGKIPNPKPQKINESAFQAQALEFVKVLNERNADGRPELEGKPTAKPEQLLAEAHNTTHVIENVLSTVINKPFGALKLDQNQVLKMVADIDMDHYHFVIPGSVAKEALEVGHVSLASIKDQQDYLLSVFDLREYGCSVMKDGVRDYFSRNPSKQQLQNESIYVISQITLNQPQDVQAVERKLGKRPQAVIVQESIYASHLVRGSKTIFAFYEEGNRTRVVLMSNLAMGSKFLSGTTGTFLRQYLLFGVNGGVTEKVLGVKDALSDLLSGATKDVAEKNSCDRGLALGLLRYSQGLFDEFAAISLKN